MVVIGGLNGLDSPIGSDDDVGTGWVVTDVMVVMLIMVALVKDGPSAAAEAAANGACNPPLRWGQVRSHKAGAGVQGRAVVRQGRSCTGGRW
jgi:hypothetical protein